MQQHSNFEAAPDKINNNSHTTDNLSADLFNFIRDDFNARRMQGSSLIQNDLPEAFRGSADFEIVDNSIGQSLIKQGALKELEYGGTPSRGRMDRNNRVSDEMPSSAWPHGATGEGSVGRNASGDQRSSGIGNKQNYEVDELPSKGRPRGAKAESQCKKNNPVETYVMPPSLHRPLNSQADTLSTPADNRKNGVTDEVPSLGRPAGANPETGLEGKDAFHGSSVADPVQQNRGSEVEGRKTNKHGKPETLINAPYAYGYM